MALESIAHGLLRGTVRVVAYPSLLAYYLQPLDIIGGRARFHRRNLLELSDRRRPPLLTLTASMFTLADRCSTSSAHAHNW